MEAGGGHAPSSTMVAAIHQRTEGNPFFVSELVRLLAPDGNWMHSEQIAATAIPLGVQEVIAARLERLSAPCRHLLQIAAVAGREFDTRVIAAAVANDARPDDAAAGPESMLAPLEEALQQRMINEARAICTYGFFNAMIRDALRGADAKPAGAPAPAHRRIAGITGRGRTGEATGGARLSFLRRQRRRRGRR
jgi:predicted ATPase